MKRHLYIISFISLFCLSLSSCGGKSSIKRFERDLHEQTRIAMQVTSELSNALIQGSIDSLISITERNEDILFYVFSREGMVYWSDNWLAGKEVRLLYYDQWYYQRFDNAHTICRWTSAGAYNILSIIPIKYAYPFENSQLENSYTHPFKLSKSYQISTLRTEPDEDIHTAEGKYLFSVHKLKRGEAAEVETYNSRLANTFSYQALQHDENGKKHFNTNFFFFIYILLFSLVILIGILGLVRNKGFRDMRLKTKIQYFTLSLFLLVSVTIFIVSMFHMTDTYRKQQHKELTNKTEYIQKNLQDMYFWKMTLSERDKDGINADLRDLSFTYQTDIHVYDLRGNLVGTSAPMLFSQGLTSEHIAPEPFFNNQLNQPMREQIGDMSYLTSYTQFYNGNYVQIGYISVPQYLSASEAASEFDSLLAKLLPPNILFLVLALLLSYLISHTLTRPLSLLSDRMKHFRIGQHNSRIQYDSNDELGQLTMRYNQLIEELERSTERLASSEREDAWRTMARQIAHEINNPLTPMKLTIQQLRRTKAIGGEKFDDYFDKSTNLLIEQIDNLSRIAQSFSQFAKMPEVKTAEVDIAQKLFSVITLFRNNQTHTPIRYIGAEEGVLVYADQEQISQVFSNLLKNALQAVEQKEGGDIIVMLKTEDESDRVEISISDNGSGIAEEIKEKIFRPNFTTKSTGTGLGLAISKNIVEGSGGDISFETSDKGTTFFVHLKKTVAL